MKKIFTLLLAASPILASAQWTSDPEVNTDVVAPLHCVYEWNYGINADGSISTVFTAPQNGRIELWHNLHDKDGKCVYADGAQLIASEPTMTWTAVGEIAFHDSKGNMIAVYQSMRNATEAGLIGDYLNYDVYKISPTGEMLWDEPLDLSRGEWCDYLQCAMSICELEDGSYMMAYCDYALTESGQHGTIYMERVSADGKLLWDEPLCLEDKAVSYAYPYLVSAGDNQAILLYVKGSNQDLVVRKVDFNGEAVWEKDVTVYRGGFPSVPVWTILSVIPDGEGGIIVGWRDDRYFTDFEKTHVSHILSDGSYGFASGVEGERVAYNEEWRSFEPTMLYDKENKYLYTLHRETSASQAYQRLMLQKMADTGELLWGPYCAELQPGDSGCALAYFDLEFAEDGNLVAFYMMQPNGVDAAAYVQKVNSETGEPMWEEPLMFTPCIESRSSLKASKLIDGKYWVVMWEDSRMLEGDPTMSFERCRLYMQRINIDGTLGDQLSVELVQEDLDVKVEGRNIIAPEGAEVYGMDGMRYGTENLSAGVYVVRCGDKAVKVLLKH